MIFSMMIVLRKPFFFFTNTARKPVEVLSMSTDLSGKKKKSPLLLSVYPFTIFNYSSDILIISKDLLFHTRLKLQHI